MASVVPLKKLQDVKLRELPSWILMQDFIPKGIAGAFKEARALWACYYWYYNKYFNMKKGSVAGLSMVPAAYVLFNYCHSYKELSESLGLLCLWWGFP
uniref:ATP synthase F(0) complex subunit f, mitochondrial n=2 Tax=Monodon monoceros TaxID=40151 RepID=A0A8C6AL39_MONMO